VQEKESPPSQSLPCQKKLRMTPAGIG